MLRSLTSLTRAALTLSACALGACGNNPPSPSDSGAMDASQQDTVGNPDTSAGGRDAGPDAPLPTTTIAAARQAYIDGGAAASITVNAVVTAVQGPAGDQVNWYIEDPAGGPYSGVVVYCDPLAASTCPCAMNCSPHVAAQPIGTLVSITGALSAYHGQIQFEPTAQTVLQMHATPPPVYTATASDLLEAGNSPYRGVYVKFATTVTVDNLTPSALYDTQCNPDGGTGMPFCSGCTPPTYAGFEVNGPGTGAFFVEETFFPFVPLASHARVCDPVRGGGGHQRRNVSIHGWHPGRRSVRGRSGTLASPAVGLRAIIQSPNGVPTGQRFTSPGVNVSPLSVLNCRMVFTTLRACVVGSSVNVPEAPV